MKILVTGGTGFIGSNLVSKLCESDHEIAIVSSKSINSSNPKIKYIKANLLNDFDYDGILKDIDIVIHLFWSNLPRANMNNLGQDINLTINSGTKLLQACQNSNIKKFIFASSGGTIYGPTSILPINENHLTNPISSYGITKLFFEKLLNLYSENSKFDCTILRLSNVYGPKQNLKSKQGVISHWLNNIINKNPIELWGSGQSIRDYVYIDDVVNAFLKVINLPKSSDCKVLNISSNQGISLLDISSILTNNLNLKFNVIKKDSDNTDVNANVLDNNLAKTKLNWIPQIGIEEGIQKTHNYLVKVSNNS